MKDQKTTPKSVKLSPEGVVLAKKLFERRKSAQAELDAFARKRDEEGAILKKAHELELDTILLQLLEVSGAVPADIRRWSVDGEFLDDHDVGFLVYQVGRPCRSCGQIHAEDEEGEATEHPLAALLAGLGSPKKTSRH